MKIPHHKALHALLAGILAFMATSASAQTPPTPVGYVKTVTGQAWVTTAGQRLPAAPGTAIMEKTNILIMSLQAFDLLLPLHEATRGAASHQLLPISPDRT